MKIVQSTWVRYHHIDLARELHKLGYLQRVFTALPWWKVSKEAAEQGIPRNRFSCNFLMQGVRRIGQKLPGYNSSIDSRLAVAETKIYSKWVARKIRECDAYIGLSGSGLHAGRIVKSRGGIYVMDRGSTHIRNADQSLGEEYRRWGVEWSPIDPWLVENEESEAREADIITIPSSFVRRTFIEYGTSPAKLKIVPYGISLSEFCPVGKPPRDRFRLLFVGQVSIRKGIPYLLEAFRNLRHPNKELVVVGGVSKGLEDVIRSFGVDDVNFVGVVPRSRVKEYMSTAHALVLPSIEEGLALVQAQALACGCPIIATPNTGCEDLFEHGTHGLVVPARDSGALTEAFEMLAECDEKRATMSAAALDHAASLGGWERYAELMVGAIQEAQVHLREKHAP